MKTLSISQAAKQWKISRIKISQAIESGQITAETGLRNSKNVDPADMLRVFGEPDGEGDQSTQPESSNKLSQDTLQLEKRVNDLSTDIRFLRNMNESLNSQNEKLLDQVEALTKELSEARKPVRFLPWLRS